MYVSAEGRDRRKKINRLQSCKKMTKIILSQQIVEDKKTQVKYFETCKKINKQINKINR